MPQHPSAITSTPLALPTRVSSPARGGGSKLVPGESLGLITVGFFEARPTTSRALGSGQIRSGDERELNNH